jgi:uncharacterized protein (DUF1015 family)
MPSEARDTGAGLVMRPFRATRYGPSVGDDLGTVTSPPYDVIDEETVDRLHASHPYNVVRLILPRRFAHTDSYDEVDSRLREWQRSQVLVEDADPALYAYEYTAGAHTVRGLVGALGLRDPGSGVVLPHEGVMPGPVQDRAELISRTRTNLEPILLVYDGGGAASDVVDQVTDEQRIVDTVARDGSSHTVWRISDPETLAAIARDLAPQRALIADGHHRYAAYRQVQSSSPEPELDYGLAMLVDQQRYPLQLGPIHRLVRGLSLDELRRRAIEGTAVKDFGADPAAAAEAAADAAASRAAFVASDGLSWAVVVADRAPAEIDTHVLHERLLPAWDVAESGVDYVHDAGHAVAEARAHHGVALLVRPPSVGAVVAAAEQGRTLPRKSTSFGPKPRMGLLMRAF